MAPPVRRKKPVSHRGDGARARIVAAALEALVEGDGDSPSPCLQCISVAGYRAVPVLRARISEQQ